MANLTAETMAEEHEPDECSEGGYHEWRDAQEKYGEDLDGNRGIWVSYEYCTKCGEQK